MKHYRIPNPSKFSLSEAMRLIDTLAAGFITDTYIPWDLRHLLSPVTETPAVELQYFSCTPCRHLVVKRRHSDDRHETCMVCERFVTASPGGFVLAEPVAPPTNIEQQRACTHMTTRQRTYNHGATVCADCGYVL